MFLCCEKTDLLAWLFEEFYLISFLVLKLVSSLLKMDVNN